MRGRLIVFEGIDGSGKSTQVELAYEWLTRKYPDLFVDLIRTPGSTRLGDRLRRLVKEADHQADRQNDISAISELFLFAADRANVVERRIKPCLDKGGIALCDRYTPSSMAYQGYGRGLDLEIVQQINEISCKGVLSDLTILIDCDVETAYLRTQRDRICDDFEFLNRVNTGYQDQRLQSNWVGVDGNQTVDQVHRAITFALTGWLNFWRF